MLTPRSSLSPIPGSPVLWQAALSPTPPPRPPPRSSPRLLQTVHCITSHHPELEARPPSPGTLSPRHRAEATVKGSFRTLWRAECAALFSSEALHSHDCFAVSLHLPLHSGNCVQFPCSVQVTVSFPNIAWCGKHLKTALLP